MFRRIVLAFSFVPFAFSQSLPAFRWVQEVDGSGSDSFAGLGVDSQGNTYIAGSTLSANFQVKAAIQNHLASDGLYRIDGPGSAYAALGLTSASSIAVDPQNPDTLYATNAGAALKSVDGGATFSALAIPRSQVNVIAIDPANDQVLYAGTTDQGALKSTDGGATWTAIDNGLAAPPEGQLSTFGLWIDPTSPNVLFANTGNFLRSADSGATWQTLYMNSNVEGVSFDTANPGTLYAVGFGGGQSLALKSTDHGQTFTSLTTPDTFGSIVADPRQSGRLVASGSEGLWESDDGGSTWTLKNNTVVAGATFTPDWANGFLYGAIAPSTIARITSDLQTVIPVGPPAVGEIAGIAVANGHAYVAVAGTHDVFVTKLDPSGNVVYSTYFGGSADDIATAMAVDATGHVYVTGTTTSQDFPITKGAFASSGGSFLFQLNSDGSLGYSTYFAPAGTNPQAIAVDAMGSAYLAGSSSGNLPTTPGAFQTVCSCGPIATGFLTIIQASGFITKFDPTGSKLVYSTYIGGAGIAGLGIANALAIASDGSAYVGGVFGIYLLNSAGSALLASSPAIVGAVAMAVGPDGSLYLAGAPGGGSNPFQTTAGAFEPVPGPPQALTQYPGSYPAEAVAKLDAQLATVQAATYFGGSFVQIEAMSVDADGNVYLGGYTVPWGLPTRTPLQEGFATPTGFVSELSSDLKTLLFSSYLGDSEHFAVQGVAAAPGGSISIGGATGQSYDSGIGPMNIYVNSLAPAAPPALRIDAVDNAASLVDGAISAGETIVVEGAGFGSDAQLLIGDAVVPAISTTATTITAVVPQSVPSGAAQFLVRSGGAASNPVLVPVGAASPGIFSVNGSGSGQGYILNQDGTLNSPANPASPGDRITIFATGVGPVSFTQGYAVTAFPANVFIDEFYADGVAAVMGPVNGLPGSVYQITVYIPIPSNFAQYNPNLANFQYPPQVGVILQLDGVSSQNGVTISISQ